MKKYVLFSFTCVSIMMISELCCHVIVQKSLKEESAGS